VYSWVTCVLNDEYTHQWHLTMHINWRDNSSVAANVLNKEVCLRNREREREIHGNIPNSILSEALRFSMLMSRCRRLALMPRGMLDRQTYTHKHITRQSLTWKKRERIREQWYIPVKNFQCKRISQQGQHITPVYPYDSPSPYYVALARGHIKCRTPSFWPVPPISSKQDSNRNF